VLNLKCLDTWMYLHRLHARNVQGQVGPAREFSVTCDSVKHGARPNVLCKKRSISYSSIPCDALTAVELLTSPCCDGLFPCLHTGSCGEVESSAAISDLVVEMVVASATASTAASLHAVPLSSPDCASMAQRTSKSRDCVDDLPCPIMKRSIPERRIRRKGRLYDAVLVSARESKGEGVKEVSA
jgi:hypothetical protein